MSQKRVVIESIKPAVNDGRYPVKRVTGDTVTVSAAIYADGHDQISARVLHAPAGSSRPKAVPMTESEPDEWEASFVVDRIGTHTFSVEAWIDHAQTWLAGLLKKAEVDAVSNVDLGIGSALARDAAARAREEAPKRKDADRLDRLAALLADEDTTIRKRTGAALDAKASAVLLAYPDRQFATTSETSYNITVDPPLAQFSSWYEVFPRSLYDRETGHGTFKDLEDRLDYISDLGFSVLYLPPIHPIGKAFRKGRNNSLVADKDDPGSPWAIGNEDGGHMAIHKELGSLSAFRSLVKAAARKKIAIALDIAFQCSPDHPWVSEHPDWFVRRPDGSIQYAENPPKKYQDIYPINFESADWEALWQALLGVFEHWIKEDVTIFRVDNPHTKSFPFWEWCIAQIKASHPQVIFLAEAFTRPRRMYGLAKMGFSQSYTYFTWRTEKWEIESYLNELVHTNTVEFYRPSFWPNTPDILHEFLQVGGTPGFKIRLVLAATLSPNYGIYGPAYELLEATPRDPGTEEYLDSEKYEIRRWNINDPTSIAPYVREINRIRNDHTALQRMRGLHFHGTDNEQIIAYSRSSEDGSDVVLVVVNLNYEHTHSAWVEFSPAAVGMHDSRPFTLRELLTGKTYTWEGYWNFVQLDPFDSPAQIFCLEPGNEEQK